MPVDMDIDPNSRVTSNATNSSAQTLSASTIKPPPNANGHLKGISHPLLSRSNFAAQTPTGASTPELAGAVNEQLNLVSEDETDDMDSIDDASEVMDDERRPPHGLPLRSLRTGLCYDPRMRFHSELKPGADELHPEDPRRIYYIYKELCQAGLVKDQMAQAPIVNEPLSRIAARRATLEEICLIHTPELFKFIESTQVMPDEQLSYLEQEHDSLYFNRLSYETALLSAGGAIETCLAVAKRSHRNAFAVIRPPGHHAEVGKAMGFCLFNNVCVAAKVCQERLGEQCRKILILDWDVHHGNGIQKAFYDDPNILYISIHVYEDGRFYPGGIEGNHEHCGSDRARGKNVNIPWPCKGMGDSSYMHAFQEIVMPISREFDPDLVIISAGFDAAAGDELGGCFVTPTCYAHMTHMLMSLANGKVAVCLEGGYNFASISKSALAVTRTLMGEPPDRMKPTKATDAAMETVFAVKMAQSEFWNCMHYQGIRWMDEFDVLISDLSSPDMVDGMTDTVRLDEVIQKYQAMNLYTDHKLQKLYILNDDIARPFRNQVLATPDFEDKENLAIIFHEPPELMGVPKPSHGKIELDKTWLADEVKGYIDWFVDNGFGVIDVNIPKDATEVSGEQEILARREMTEKLGRYLWDNYIDQTCESEHIFFIGVGDAYHGLSQLLIHNVDVYQRITAVVTFTAKSSLRSVTSNDNAFLAPWYRDHSRVFVSDEHDAWTRDKKKLSKRYGTLVKSPMHNLQKMIRHHRKEVFQYISEQANLGRGDTTEDEVTMGAAKA